MEVLEGSFIWNVDKEDSNLKKHGVDFSTAANAFSDPHRKIFADEKHSANEERTFCIAKVDRRILTVRVTLRGKKIRIHGAGYWRKGKSYYEQ